MGLAAVLLIVAAAFAHAGWNFFAKRAGSGGPGFVWLNSALAAALYLPVMLASLLVTGLPPLGLGVLAVVVSAALHVGYYVLLQRGYAVGDMSVVYPLARGTGPLLTVAVATTALGEHPRPLGIVGALVVIAGVFVIGFSDLGQRGSGHTLAGVGFGLLTGCMIAMYTLWDSRAVTALALPPLVFDWANNACRALLLAPYAVRQRGRVREVWKQHRTEVVVVAVLSPLAYILVLFAMQLAPVSLVGPARELSIVLASLAAWRLLREPQPRQRLTGAVIVLCGVAMVGSS